VHARTEKCVRGEARAREGRCATRLCVRTHARNPRCANLRAFPSCRDERCEWKLDRAIAESQGEKKTESRPETERTRETGKEKGTRREAGYARAASVDASRFVESGIEEDVGGLKPRGEMQQKRLPRRRLNEAPSLSSRYMRISRQGAFTVQANCFSADARLYRDPIGYQKR
jgi:hypothetical protein